MRWLNRPNTSQVAGMPHQSASVASWFLILSCRCLQGSPGSGSFITLFPYLSTSFRPTFSPTRSTHAGEGKQSSWATASENSALFIPVSAVGSE